MVEHIWDPEKQEYTRDVEQGDRVISHHEWRKLFKKCRCKRFKEKSGGKPGAANGGLDVQCIIIGGLRWGRCYYSKCPKIKQNWESEKKWYLEETSYGKDFPKCINENLLLERA